MSTNKTTSKIYTIMKDGNKIKTAKSLNTAKAIADQEQAEVFCCDECVYKAQRAAEASQTAEASEEVKAVNTVHAVQSSEVQSDVGDIANPAAKEETAASKEEASVSDMAAANPSTEKAVKSASLPTVATTAVEEEPILGVAIHSTPHTPQPKFENYRLTALMNVRAEASMDAKVLRTAPAGTVVQVCKFEDTGSGGNSAGNSGGNWMKIRNGSDFAYILYEKDGKKFAEKVGG